MGANRNLFFESESVENEPCLNSTIDIVVINQPDKITLKLNGIKTATDCNIGEGPARSTINAGSVDAGVYNLLVVVGNTVENEGKLSVNDSRYEIEMYSMDGIFITNKTLHRIPSNSLWGYIAYDDEILAGTAPDEFISDLESITETNQLVEGYYGQFEIKSTGELTLRTLPTATHYQTFSYHFNGELNDLKNLIQDHRNSTNGVMEIVVYTSDGKIL